MLYAFILAPFGAIIVFEHFFHKKASIVKNYTEAANSSLNKSVFGFGQLVLVFSSISLIILMCSYPLYTIWYIFQSLVSVFRNHKIQNTNIN